MTRRRCLATLGSALGVAMADMAWPAAAKWEVRYVREGDQSELRELMQVCVKDDAAMFGLCRALEWTMEWASQVIRLRPNSLVAVSMGRIVGYADVPPPLTLSLSGEIPYRKAFWCAAGGAREDLLGRAEALRVFRTLVAMALREARDGGYERVRCAAPWLTHPCLGLPFDQYVGVLVERFRDDEGSQRYLIDWELGDAIRAFEIEIAASR